jgi:hypothetical protein
MSCLRYLYLFVYSGVQHILCSVFVLLWSSSCLPYVAVVSLDCPFVIALSVFSNVYKQHKNTTQHVLNTTIYKQIQIT